MHVSSACVRPFSRTVLHADEALGERPEADSSSVHSFRSSLPSYLSCLPLSLLSLPLFR